MVSCYLVCSGVFACAGVGLVLEVSFVLEVLCFVGIVCYWFGGCACRIVRFGTVACVGGVEVLLGFWVFCD